MTVQAGGLDVGWTEAGHGADEQAEVGSAPWKWIGGQRVGSRPDVLDMPRTSSWTDRQFVGRNI